MSGKRLMAYEGDGEYAFASYCHKDEALVLPLIEALVDAGVNVWYDEGIDPGDEWPKIIQQHIEGCSVFVAFVSSASQASHNCRRELNEALTRRKPTIPVLLEDCEKSLATEVLLSRLQAMKCWEYGSQEECGADLAGFVSKKWTGKGGGRGAEDITARDDSGDGDLGMPNGSMPPELPPEACETEAADNTPKKKKRHLFPIAAAMAMIVCAVVLAVFQPWNSPNPESKTSDNMSVLLTPDKGASIEEFNADLESIEHRLDVFVGEGLYEMSKNSELAVIEIPRLFFGDVDVKDALRCYLTRPIRIYLTQSKSLQADGDGELLEVPRSEIDAMEVVESLPEELSTSKLGADYPVGCKAFKLTLSKEFLARNAGILDRWGEDMAIVQDPGSSDSCSYEPVARDGNALYFVDRNQESIPSILDTVAFNYTHDPLSAPMMFTVNWDSLVDWQVPSEISLRGSNQLAENELEGKQALLRYADGLGANAEGNNEHEQLNLEASLKKRFDALRLPYAFGFADEEADDGGITRYAVIKTAWDSLDVRYAQIAACGASDRKALLFEEKQLGLNVSDDLIQIAKDKSGSWRIVVSTRDANGKVVEPSGQLIAFSNRLKKGDVVSFVLGDHVALKARFVGLGELDSLAFDQVTTVDGESVDNAGAEWAAEFYKTCLETWEQIPEHLELRDGFVAEKGTISKAFSTNVGRVSVPTSDAAPLESNGAAKR